MFRFLTSLCFFLSIYGAFPSFVHAELQITSYFKNDSVNGLKISDAYETHNMGLILNKNDTYLQLDLGIVSPDMHQYKNEYRIANRSFGEIISVSVGKKNQKYKELVVSYYANLKTSGEYGIDGMQDWMHRVLTLQPVNKVNDIVRMPNKAWVGIGGQTNFDFSKEFMLFDSFGLEAYFGTDAIAFNPYVKGSKEYTHVRLTQEIGVQIRPFDEVVSAPPISAGHRAIIPYIEVGIEFNYLGTELFIKDRFSLPTVKSDNRPFGVLHAGVNFKFD